MKYLVIAYDENQIHWDEPLNLYDYLRNEFDNQGIVAGIVECESFNEIVGSAEWLDGLYNQFLEKAES